MQTSGTETDNRELENGQPASSSDEEVGYRVFYADSEEEAKLMAITYLQANVGDSEPPIERKDVPFSRYFSGLILPILLYGAITVLMILFSDRVTVWPFISAYVLVFVFTLKYFVIFAVLFYQRFAPDRLRKACRFEPTCSNYMLMAIEKYGFWKGFAKGIVRLSRCHVPNGGVDYP